MTDPRTLAPPAGRPRDARPAGRRRPPPPGEAGAVTAEYAVLLPVIAFVLVAVLLAGAAAVQQVRGQDAAAAAARILARGDAEADAREAVARMAGPDAVLAHTAEEGWVAVTVSQSGPGPLGWADALTLTARAAAPQQRPGTDVGTAAGPDAGPDEDRA